MAHAYAPGLTVSERTMHRARRVLPLEGEVLVKAGDQVEAQQVVARAFMPGDVLPVNLANALSVSPGDVPGAMLKHEGDKVEVGDVLARTNGIFGYFKQDYHARVAGTIESVSKVTGQVILRGDPQPVEVKAYLTGKVVEALPKEGAVIEAEVTLVQGIFGIGGEAFGPIRMVSKTHEQLLTEDLLREDVRGAIVVGGGRVTATAVRRCIDLGAAAIVAGGIDDADLRDFLGYDLGVAITGSEQIGLTLIITEGFGDIAMARRTFDLLRHHAGQQASVNGATQIRAGVMRPEIVIPHTGQVAAKAAETERVHGLLAPGTAVRIIRDPYFGLLGTVKALPSEPHVLESGSKARVLTVDLESGETLVVPRANVELIEG